MHYFCVTIIYVKNNGRSIPSKQRCYDSANTVWVIRCLYSKSFHSERFHCLRAKLNRKSRKLKLSVSLNVLAELYDGSGKNLHTSRSESSLS